MFKGLIEYVRKVFKKKIYTGKVHYISVPSYEYFYQYADDVLRSVNLYPEMHDLFYKNGRSAQIIFPKNTPHEHNHLYAKERVTPR